MNKNGGFLNFLLALCWVMIVITGSLTLGSLWPLTSAPDAGRPAPAAPQATLSPQLADQLPDFELLKQQLTQIAKGKFTAQGRRQITVSTDEDQINQILEYYGSGIVDQPRLQLKEAGEVELTFGIADPDSLFSLVPALKEYSSLINLARGSQVSVGALLDCDEQGQPRLTLKKISVAGVSLPSALVKTAGQSLSRGMEQVLKQMETLKIDKLEISDQKLELEGTIPQSLVLPPQ